MFIQAKRIKGIVYFYLVHNMVNEKGDKVKDFEKCLGNQEKTDSLFQRYIRLKERCLK